MYYVLSTNKFDKSFAYCEYDDDSIVDDKSIEKCPLCGSNVSNIPVGEPYHIKLSSKKVGDFIFGIFDYIIVSQHFKDMYEKSNLNGIQFFKRINRVRYKKEILDVDLYGIKPKRIGIKLGWESAIYENNGRKICEMCNPHGKIIYGGVGLKIISENHSEIPDIFSTYMTGMSVYCNQSFIDFCLENEFSNFRGHYESFADYTSGACRKLK